MFRPWEDNKELVGVKTVHVKAKVHLSMCCKEMVLRVYQGLLKYLNPSEALKMACELTQVPNSTVWKIIDKHRKGEIFTKKIRCDKGIFRKVDCQDITIIGKTIYDMYSKKEIPTVDSIKRWINADNDYPRIKCGRETLRKCIIEMGFRFQTIDKRQAIMETSRLRQWRFDYLSKIDNFRQENRSIFYLDETWFDTHDTVKKGWVNNSPKCKLDVPSSRGKRITILHCGSENGWAPDALLLSAKNIKDCSLDYHQDMSAELFEKWFEFTLIPKLPPNSVIVLDNASYHSRLFEKIPTTASNKTEIKEFLLSRNLFYEDSYSKKDLLEVLHTQTFEKCYFIDELALKNGHSVLRLPPYHCIFNPIELIWGQLKNQIRRKNTNPKFSSSILALIKSEVNLILPENWKNAIKHVISVENNFRKLYENMNSFVINVNSSSSSSNGSDDDIE